MSLDFKPFKAAIAAQFAHLQKHELFRTSISGDALWEAYLAAFPPGTDPLYRERSEHNCSTCRAFVKAVGSVVIIVNNKPVSLWDLSLTEAVYQQVANSLSALVKSHPIENVFVHPEAKVGFDKNFEEILGKTQTYDHFFVNLLPASVMAKAAIPTYLGKTRTTHEMMLRSLTEITADSIATVLELISQNSIYRGEEHRFALTSFEKLKREFAALPAESQDMFVWSRVKNTAESVSRMRGTVIGTLLVDISEGKRIDEAVKSFESKVAPANYKRPTALVTKAMITKAQEKIEELGLMSALTRRYAVLTDIDVPNVLHVNSETRSKMTNVFEELSASLPEKVASYDKVEEVPIDKFLKDILPRVESVEVLLENQHAGNLVTLMAPGDPTAGQLFKWNNGFSWDYAGNFADSIKERVKKAGGSVTGNLCCRLGWFNYDDLDLHLVEPQGTRIYYGQRLSPGAQGRLDVDMNAGGKSSREPVENIYYGQRSRMQEGIYRLEVNQFHSREKLDIGFEVEIDYLGEVLHLAYDKPMKARETVVVATFEYTHAKGLQIITSLPTTQTSKLLWGLPTKTFHKAHIVMYSPNYWDGQIGIGNRHVFFMLEGAKREDQSRGIYNEFLRADLDEHRKAFEMVGSKMKSEGTDEQLTGVGFSSTQRNYVIVRVKGALSRVLKVTF